MVESFTLRLLWMVLPPSASAFLTTKPPPLHSHTDPDFLATLATPHPTRITNLLKIGIRGPALAAAKRLNTIWVKYQMLCNHGSASPVYSHFLHQLLDLFVHYQPFACILLAISHTKTQNRTGNPENKTGPATTSDEAAAGPKREEKIRRCWLAEFLVHTGLNRVVETAESASALVTVAVVATDHRISQSINIRARATSCT